MTGVYHPLCFCCSACSKPLGEDYYSLDSDNKVSFKITWNKTSFSWRTFRIADIGAFRFTVWLTTAPWCPPGAPGVVTTFSLWRTRASWSGYRWAGPSYTTSHVAFIPKAMNQTFHVDCFACNICGCRLSDDPGERWTHTPQELSAVLDAKHCFRCYPLNGKALCSKCHVRKLHSGKKAVSFQQK